MHAGAGLEIWQKLAGGAAGSEATKAAAQTHRTASGNIAVA